ncbi:MAG: adenosylcobinamide-phosphate synthase CbiB, partial [Albidovulum sp.]
LPGGWIGLVITGILAWPFIAAKSLADHVAAVARPLAAGDLAGARGAVAMIVGRDPEQLDEAGVARAALESLAENASDGVIAPLFWGAIFGLPGIVGYKAVNTLDSMIGHRTSRHEAFGWAAARIDDIANLIPARLTGLLFAAVSGRFGPALAIMRRDAGQHRSPNAGWPEAAMAAALGIRLSGPRVYHDRVADEPWINAEAPDPGAGTLQQGLTLYRKSLLAVAVLLALLAATALI